MSSENRVEPDQSSEEPQGDKHVCVDSPEPGEDLGEDVDEEQGHQPPIMKKEVTLKLVDEDKQPKRKEVQKSLRRRQDAQRTKTAQVIQADGTATDAVCLVERNLNVSRRVGLQQHKDAGQIQHAQRDKHPESPSRHGPFFYFEGGNGVSIVVPYFVNRGWQRIYDKNRKDYKLKWCEIKKVHTYDNFRTGEQLVYQIPNNKVLTTKIGLLNSLREYERVSSKVKHGQQLRILKMEDFFPDTYRMDVKHEREAFFAKQEEHCNKGNIWICKPSGLNQGRGIFLLQTPDEKAAFRDKMQILSDNTVNKKINFLQAHIVQRYIQNPLLLQGRKFDVRSYLLIGCTSPYMVFFRHGYVRLTCDLYDPNSNNLTAHLTNQYMQKKNPLYSILKDETVWSMERFNIYVNEEFMVSKGLPKDWVLGAFTKKMQQIMIQCFLAVKFKLECKLGYFDLIGCDFLIDENFKVWLLEMNCNPALHTNCEVLKEVVPKLVTETLDLAMEIFNKCRCGLKLLPLTNQQDFVLLYCGESAGVSVAKHRSRTGGPVRMAGFKCLSNNRKTKQGVSKTPQGNNTSGNTVPNVSQAAALTSASIRQGSVLQTVLPKQNSSDKTFLFSGNESTTVIPAHHSESKYVAGTSQQTPRFKPEHMSHPKTKVGLTRVELSLTKCSWQQPEVTYDLRNPEVTRPKKSTFSPVLSDCSNYAHRVQEESWSFYVKPADFHLSQSLSCQSLCIEKPRSFTNTK